MKKLGFYQQLLFDTTDVESLKMNIRDHPHPLENQIIDYLKKGHVIAVAACIAKDVFDKQTDIGELSAMTDGKWLWHSDIPYYVERYHLRLPDEFIEHAQSYKWIMPKVDAEKLTCNDSH